MRGTWFEAALGAVVLVVAGGFLAYALGAAPGGNDGAQQRRLRAGFRDVGGITAGTEVRVAGVRVGRVDAVTLDLETMRAQVVLSVDAAIPVYEDASLKVASESLLGGSFLALDPGAGIDLLGEDGVITITQSGLNLQDALGQVIHGLADGGGGTGGGGTGGDAQ